MNSWPLRLIGRIEESFAIACLIAIAVIINLQIFQRYVMNAPFIWPEEVIRITMIWLTFVGAGIAFRRGAHITVDTLVNAMPPAVRTVVLDVADLMIVAVFVVVGMNAVPLAQIVSNDPMPATNMPTAIIVWPLVLAAVQAVGYSLLRIVVRHIDGLDAVQSEPVRE